MNLNFPLLETAVAFSRVCKTFEVNKIFFTDFMPDGAAFWLA